jgi:putative endonuclease
MNNSRRIGRAAEDAAVAFLESQGLTVVARNYLRRAGELDIVARQHDVLAIVEVRTRGTEKFGGAAASVDSRKQRRIIRAAAQLLQKRADFAALAVRFDVIVVYYPPSEKPRVEWIQHAFAA